MLLQLYQGTNILTTIFVVLITGFVGLQLARRQGMKAWRNIHQEMAAGRTPSKEIMNGVMILLAGTFLITPGLLTDGVGFALLVPKLREQIGMRLSKWFREKTVTTFQSNVWPGGNSATAAQSPIDADEFQLEQPSVRVVDPNEPKASR